MQKIYRFTHIVLLFICGLEVNGQDTISDHQLTISAYVDGYYSVFDDEAVRRGNFQRLTTVGARSNSLGVNIAQLGLTYSFKDIRSNLILHHGDIAQATWSRDFNFLQEANVGVKLAGGLWIDVGFFATHIGTESFLPKNNMLSSTAVKTFNEPFYQSGARMTYEGSDQFDLQLWVLNGYNSFVDNNSAKSLGVLFTYHFDDHTSLTYTNLYGRESDDDARFDQFRFYQNLYLNKDFAEHIFLQIGFDFSRQTNSKIEDRTATANMFAGVATARYQLNPQISMTGRFEIFNDPDGFIGGLIMQRNGAPNGYELYGLTLGTEYRPQENAYLRAEVRQLTLEENLPIFLRDNSRRNNRLEFLVTMGVELEKVFAE